MDKISYSENEGFKKYKTVVLPVVFVGLKVGFLHQDETCLWSVSEQGAVDIIWI